MFYDFKNTGITFLNHKTYNCIFKTYNKNPLKLPKNS